MTMIVGRVGLICAGHAVTFQEIASWMGITGIDLTPWEAETVRKMSGAYCNGVIEYRDKFSPPPVYHDDRPITEVRKDVSDKVSQIFERYSKDKPKGRKRVKS